MIAAWLALSLWASAGGATRSVYLNNVNIDSLRSQKFENCLVEIDALGNVFITAKGYKVEVVGQSAAADEPVQKRYWLVTEKPSPGMDQYDIDVSVNGKFFKTIRSGDDSGYVEISKLLHRGNNQVLLFAKKNIAGERKSTSKAHFTRVVVGEGAVTAEQIVIEKALIDYQRSAADLQSDQVQFTVEGR